MKKLTSYGVILVLVTTLFIGISSSSVYAESKKVKLTFDSTELVADKDGSVIIKGATSPKAKLKINKKKVKIEKDGSFEYDYKLDKSDDSKTLNAIATEKKYKKNKQKIIIISFEKNEQTKKEKDKREKEREQARKKEEAEKIDDITKLSDEPTLDQQTILDSLAEQQFDSMYPYKGSKMHTILGVIQPWTQSDGKWYRKVEATIVNAYGAEISANVEVHITPTSPNGGDVELISY